MLSRFIGIGAVAVVAIAPHATAQDLDRALEAFWKAGTAEARSSAARAVLALEPSVDAVRRWIEADGRYPVSPRTGRVEYTRTNADGTEHHTVYMVPEDYDPARRYEVRVYLHGGVSRPAWSPGGGWWRNYDRFAGDGRISVFPASWNESMWWEDSQVENLRGILTHLKQRYNVDENRIYLFGISDGGSGVYFQAFRASTAWAGFVPLIGHPAVVGNIRLVGDNQMHVTNLRNRPFYVVNGGRDRLYPVSSVQPMIDLFRAGGVTVEFHPKPDAGHNVRWWPDETARIDAFLAAHPRDPLPNSLTWETERTDRYARHHWLVIDELGDESGFEPLVDMNTVVVGGRSQSAFPRYRPAGRVDLARTGNTVTARTRGVRRFRLLLSPEEFDFSRPVRVVVNGAVVFDAVVPPDVATLLEWAAADLDRTMLFTAELAIDVP